MTTDLDTLRDRLAGGDITIQQAAAESGLTLYYDGNSPVLLVEPDVWHADDGNAEVWYQTKNGTQAAQMYVDDGDWGDRSETTWISVYAWRIAIDEDGDYIEVDRDSHTIALEAEEPECDSRDGHDWQSPYDILGGCEENPGVWGQGGGIVIHEVCMRCGCERTTDTWAQNPETGEQGLHSTDYEQAKYSAEVAQYLAAHVEWQMGEPDTEGLIPVIILTAELGSLSATASIDADGDIVRIDGDDFPCSGDWPEPPQDLIDEAAARLSDRADD